jgi:hypothetical protein
LATPAAEQGWIDYWKENMGSLGYTVPNYVGTRNMVDGTIGALMAAVKQFGTKVTVKEVIIAGAGLEKWAAQGYLYAAYVAGAMIGSAAVATGRSLAGGTSIADVMMEIHLSGQASPQAKAAVRAVLIKHPEIYQADHPARPFFITRGPR